MGFVCWVQIKVQHERLANRTCLLSIYFKSNCFDASELLFYSVLSSVLFEFLGSFKSVVVVLDFFITLCFCLLFCCFLSHLCDRRFFRGFYFDRGFNFCVFHKLPFLTWLNAPVPLSSLVHSLHSLRLSDMWIHLEVVV